MNKNDLGRAVYEAHGGLSQADSLRLVDLILEIIKGRLAQGEKVLLSGFGCLRVVERKNRLGVNPQTGERMTIAGRKAITFTPSKYIKSL